MSRLRPSPPTVVLVVLCAMYFLYFVNRTNLAIAGPLIQKDLGLDNGDLGLVLAAFGIPYGAFQLFGGAVGDRFGPRLTLTVSAIFVCAATGWIGLAGGLVSLFAARILLGIGEGAGFPTATRAMSAWTPQGRWGFAQGITHTFSRIGNAMTALIIASLIGMFSWRASFFVLAPVTLLWAAVWFWYFRDDPGRHPAMTADVLARLPRRAQDTAKSSIPWLALAHRIAPVTIVDFCYGWFLTVFQTWIPSYFIQNHGLNLGETALFSAGVLTAGVIGDTLGGVLSDIVLRRTGSVSLARQSIIMLGFLGACMFMVPVVLTSDLMIATICLALAFFFAELIVGPIWAVPMDIAPHYAGTASGMMNFGFGFASVVSPMFFGYTIELTGNWTTAFSTSIALLLLGALLTSYLNPDVPFKG